VIRKVFQFTQLIDTTVGLVLSSFDFDIKYVKSEDNTADFLSRMKSSKLKIENHNEECISINFINEQSPLGFHIRLV